MRELLISKKEEAKEAVDLFCYRAAREMAALCTIMNGCDAIVFTAGIGENVPVVRKKICEWLEWLGIQLDDENNNTNSEIISDLQSKVIIAVIATNEDYMIAKHTKSLIKEKSID
jgi:acetate kinase